MYNALNEAVYAVCLATLNRLLRSDHIDGTTFDRAVVALAEKLGILR